MLSFKIVFNNLELSSDSTEKIHEITLSFDLQKCTRNYLEMNKNDFEVCRSALEKYLIDDNLFEGQLFRCVNLFCNLDSDCNEQFFYADLMINIDQTDSPQEFEFWILEKALDFFEKNGCITSNEKTILLNDFCKKINIELPKICLKLQDLCMDVIRGPGFFDNKRLTDREKRIFGIDIAADIDEKIHLLN